MKKFILLFLLIPSLCFAVEPIDFSKSIAMSPAMLGLAGGKVASGACSGSDTYFGFTDTSTISGYQTDANYVKRSASVRHNMPAGKTRVCSLGVYAKSAGGTPGVVAVAIYAVGAGPDYYPAALLCYGTAITVSSTSVSWVENTYDEITPVGGSQGEACEIAEGTEVIIVANKSTTDVSVGFLTQTSGDQKYNTGTWWSDYTWPNPGSSFVANVASANCWRIRAGAQ